MDPLLSPSAREMNSGQASVFRAQHTSSTSLRRHRPRNSHMNKLAFVLTALFLTCVTPAPAHAQHNVSLAWTASASAAGNPSLTYNVYRSPGCSGTFTLLNTTGIAATTFLDVAVPPGTYCYQATAVLAGVESAPSNEASAIVPGTVVITVPLGPPTACSHRGPLIGWIRCIGSRPHGPKKTP